MALALLATILIGGPIMFVTITQEKTVEFGDIVNTTDNWLRKLRNSDIDSRHHSTVFNTLRRTRLDELEQHPTLCRKLAMALPATYTALLPNADGERGKFWVLICGSKQHQQPRAELRPLDNRSTE